MHDDNIPMEFDSFRIDFEEEINERLKSIAQRDAKKLTEDAKEIVKSETGSNLYGSNVWARTDHEVISRMHGEFKSVQSLDAIEEKKKDSREDQNGTYWTKLAILICFLVTIFVLKEHAEKKESETAMSATNSEALNSISSRKPTSSAEPVSVAASKASDPMPTSKEGEFRAFVRNPVPKAQ